MENNELVNDICKKLKDITGSDFDSLELLVNCYKIKCSEDIIGNNNLENYLRKRELNLDDVNDLKFLQKHFLEQNTYTSKVHN